MTGPLTRLEPMPTATAAPLVLGIESSCDETGVGIVREKDVSGGHESFVLVSVRHRA